MFVDPGIGLVVAQRVNRWLRSRRRPRGVPDPYFRGVRLQYNPTYRLFMVLVCAFLLALACVLYLVPDLFADKSRWTVLLVKTAWLGITAVAILAPLQAFREFAVVSDDGVLKSSLFGVQSRMSWDQITGIRVKAGENDIIFLAASGAKMKLSLCYDGWQDFRELAHRHVQPHLIFALTAALTEEPPRRRKR